MHYSLSTEKNLPALGEIFRSLAWHNGVMRYPREMAGLGIGAFLTMLAAQRKGISL
jgi:hypothetical protein